MKMKIEFDQHQLQVLDKALQQLPYWEVAPVINAINRQLETYALEMQVAQAVHNGLCEDEQGIAPLPQPKGRTNE